MNANRDKTQEELRLLERKLADIWRPILDSSINGQEMAYLIRACKDESIEAITHFINKYYVPKGDLEDPSVSTEVGGNQVVKGSKTIQQEHDFRQAIDGSVRGQRG